MELVILTHLSPGTIRKYSGTGAGTLLFKFITQLLSSKFIVTGNISQVINYVTPASSRCNSYYIMSVAN